MSVPAAARALERQPTVVLVLDDEPGVRDYVALVLTEAGYVVCTAADPRDAFQLLAARRAPVDLLITDIKMPGMTGLDFARTLCDERPQLRVLFVSAFPRGMFAPRSAHGWEIAGEADLTHTDLPFLAKPFGHDALLTSVERVLAAPPVPLRGLTRRWHQAEAGSPEWDGVERRRPDRGAA